MQQWAANNQYNSFNPMKGLLYREQYEEIARGRVPVPVQARIDPTLKCPLACKWCNSAQYRKHGHELSEEHITNVLGFLKKWGVKAVVWAGGGEPTYHPQFEKLLNRNATLGMDAAILSNGMVYNPDVAKAIGELCRWVGISVDAGSAETYARDKGCATFDMVINNIALMAKHAKYKGIGYKFLITPTNQHEVYQACQIAYNVGAHDFIARPMDTHHQGMTNTGFDHKDFDADEIFRQFDKCHKLESEHFHVYTVMHKFNPDFSHSKGFGQCYGAPLRIHIATDGNVYFCDDQYYQEEYRIGSHYPDPAQILEFWGKGKHRELLYGGTPARCTTRCCVSNLCEQCERLFVNGDDPMCMNYP
jgi:MoaA/NifB/PqqE/SkfB family radical SAM enzyme